MRTLMTATLLGWMFWTLGNYDENGRFFVLVTASVHETRRACLDERQRAEETGWDVQRTCVAGPDPIIPVLTIPTPLVIDP